MTLDPAEGEMIADTGLARNRTIDISGFANPRTFAEGEMLLEQLLGLNQFDRNNPQQEGTTRPSISIRNFATQVQTIVDELTNSGKLAPYILSQAALHALNPSPPGRGQIVNPATIVFGPPPFFGGITTNALDTGISFNQPVTQNPGNVLGELYDGVHINAQPEAGIPPFSAEGPSLRIPADDGSSVGAGLASIVEASTGQEIPQTSKTLDQLGEELNILHRVPEGGKDLSDFILADPYEQVNVVIDNVDGVGVERPDIAAVFELQKSGPSFLMGGRGANFFKPKPEIRSAVVNFGMVGAQVNKDTFFSAEDVENGFLSELIDETKAVVPFYFEDLRLTGRYLYFRAFLDSFSETISPDWNVEKFYGRIDPVVTYMNTNRTFNISFKIVAMSKAGLTAMWRKINNLCKMLYPTFTEGILSAGPVIRLRIGDVLAAETGGIAIGLPGILTNLEFDYSSATWELQNFQSTVTEELGKAPQWATISFSFQVIHEQNPSIDSEYNFNSKNFRRMGTLTTDIANINGDSQTQSENERMQQDANGTTGTDSDSGVTDSG